MISTVHLLLLVIVLRLEALVREVLALSFKVLPNVRVIGHHTILMAPDTLDIGISALIVQLALEIFLVL